MAYITLADLGAAIQQRVPTVADKVAITKLVEEIEFAGNTNVRVAWAKYQDVMNAMKSLQGWSDSGSGYDSLARLNERMGQVIGGFTQVMSYGELLGMVNEITAGLNAVQPGGSFNALADPAVRRFMAMFGGPVAWLSLYQSPRSQDVLFANQQLFASWLDLLIIAKDSRRITPAQFTELMARANQSWKKSIEKQEQVNKDGEGISPCVDLVMTCVTKGPGACWDALPACSSWGRTAVVVGGVLLIGMPTLYFVTIFSGFIKAAGNIAASATSKNAPRRRVASKSVQRRR